MLYQLYVEAGAPSGERIAAALAEAADVENWSASPSPDTVWRVLRDPIVPVLVENTATGCDVCFYAAGW
jgi:hypothetical protein